jgi:hypothetical protein
MQGCAAPRRSSASVGGDRSRFIGQITVQLKAAGAVIGSISIRTGGAHAFNRRRRADAEAFKACPRSDRRMARTAR